jgi:hypothetical protein
MIGIAVTTGIVVKMIGIAVTTGIVVKMIGIAVTTGIVVRMTEIAVTMTRIAVTTGIVVTMTEIGATTAERLILTSTGEEKGTVMKRNEAPIVDVATEASDVTRTAIEDGIATIVPIEATTGTGGSATVTTLATGHADEAMTIFSQMTHQALLRGLSPKLRTETGALSPVPQLQWRIPLLFPHPLPLKLHPDSSILI